MIIVTRISNELIRLVTMMITSTDDVRMNTGWVTNTRKIVSTMISEGSACGSYIVQSVSQYDY